MNALILVDIQNDFLPGGALAVPDGDKIVPVANALMAKFDLVVATQDWHPSNHGSFASQYPGRSVGDVVELNGLDQILWPDHCVQNTPGAQFADGLDLNAINRVFDKGTDTGVDSYSGLFDNGRRNATGLGEYLKGRGVTQIAVCGLATDYCVKFTVLDAVELGFETTLVEDACRGVDLKAGDMVNAIEEMKAAGVKVVSSADIDRPGDAGTVEDIRFYGTKGEYGCFSNFAGYPFVRNGNRWPTSEHYFQAQKFPGTDQERRIREAKSPMVAARMGRSRKIKIRRDWESVKVSIMADALHAKFTQHDELRDILLATGEAKLVEHTPRDSYWGDGGDGSGKNMLGQLLMKLRDELRKEQAK